MKNSNGPRYFNIIGRKYYWFAFSGILLVVSIVALIVNGLSFGVEFSGGTEMDITTSKGTTLAQVRSAMGEADYADAIIQSSGKDSFIVRTSKLDEKQKRAVIGSLEKNVGMKKNGYSMNDVGPGWGAHISRQALLGLVIFLILVMIYISIRFDWKMAVCAIVSLIFHDLVIVIGIYALFQRQVTPATAIAILTILGYSMYDTIVIFDRVKEDSEQLTRQSKKTFSESVNDSVNESLWRSLNTSITTLIPIVAILFFGGTTLKDFAFALFLGVLTGTYSSMFVASPLLAIWKEREPKYQAYQERVKRQEARRERVTADVNGAQPKARTAPGEGEAAPKPATAAKKKEAKPAAPAVKVETAPRPKAPATGQGGEKAAPQKAKQAPKKSSAKSRTKGPGSGKKKKKKR